MADKTQDKISRREVYAFVALQVLPMPAVVQLTDSLSDVDPGDRLVLRFYGAGSATAATAWAELLGAVSSDPYPYLDGFEPHVDVWHRGEWRGWAFIIQSREPAQASVEPPLDEDTAAALREIAGGDQ